MAKSRKRDFSVSLFPFLSILACVLGVLTLMITSVVLTQIDDESVDQAKEEVLQKKQNALKKALEDIQQEKEWVEPIRKDVLLGREIALLTKQIKSLEENKKPEAKSDTEVRKEILALQEKNRELQKIIQTTPKTISKLQKEVDIRTNPAGYATVSVGRSRSALGETITPIFIECTKDGLSIYNEKGEIDYKVSTAQARKDAKLRQLVQRTAKNSQVRVWKSLAGSEIKATFIERKGIFVVLREPNGKLYNSVRPESLTAKSRQALLELEKIKQSGQKTPAGHYVIFLVRPDGIVSWTNGRDLCLSMNCKNGKLPIPSEGPINVKSFVN